MIPIRKSISRIEKLGRQVVSCDLQCKGITNNRKNGVVPRSPVLDPQKCKPDCIIVGMNPGHAKEERKRYMEVASKSPRERYDAQKHNFVENCKERRRYFGQAREFAKKLKYENILWTNLCKCENEKEGKIVPSIQTFRSCMKRFLKCELECFPRTPIVALGCKAFDVVSYRFPDRLVIGVPHPSGSRGGIFGKVLKMKDKKLRKLVRAAKKNKAAIWLSKAR